jgi:hypothetical protein
MKVRYFAAVPDEVVNDLGIYETIRRALRISEEGAPEELILMQGSLSWKIRLDGREFYAVRHKGVNEDCFMLYSVI